MDSRSRGHEGVLTPHRACVDLSGWMHGCVDCASCALIRTRGTSPASAWSLCKALDQTQGRARALRPALAGRDVCRVPGGPWHSQDSTPVSRDLPTSPPSRGGVVC